MLFGAVSGTISPVKAWGSFLILALALVATPVSAAIFGVPTNLNAAGQVCTAVGTPAGCTAVSADPPGWLVLERLNSGSANGDIVHQIRFFVEVTGTTLDIRVFDAGLVGCARPWQRGDVPVPPARRRRTATLGVLTIDATTRRDSPRTASRASPARTRRDDGRSSTPPNAAAGATNRIWGGGAGGNCAGARAGALHLRGHGSEQLRRRGPKRLRRRVPATRPATRTTPTRSATGDDTIATVSATDTSMISGACRRRPAHRQRLRLHGLLPVREPRLHDRGEQLRPRRQQRGGQRLGRDDGGRARRVDDLARSNNNDVAATAVTVEASTIANPISNNYGMFTLTTQLDEWATAQNHVDWRIADFTGRRRGVARARCRASRRRADPHVLAERLLRLLGLRLHAHGAHRSRYSRQRGARERREPAAARAAPPRGSRSPATVANLGTTAITNVPDHGAPRGGHDLRLADQYDRRRGGSLHRGVGRWHSAAAPSRRSRRGAYASLVVEVDYQPPATGLQDLTATPASPHRRTRWCGPQYTPASQSATFPRTETLGPICELSVTAAPSVDLRLMNAAAAPTPDP